jgi:TDG/mug DNA glycosylase family protein
VEHHFARPGNRFWPVLQLAGFTPRQLAPWEDQCLPSYGLGLTNLVERATATTDRLTPGELRVGAHELAGKVERYRPGWLAVLGIGAFKTGFGKARATVGPQPESIGGVRVWVLPNPSGLNANYQRHDLAEAFAELRRIAFDLSEG